MGFDPAQDEPGQSLSVLHCLLASLRQCATTNRAPPLSHPAAISTCSEQAHAMTVNGHSARRLPGARLFQPSRAVGTLMRMHAERQKESV